MTEQDKDAKIKKLEVALVNAWHRERALRQENDHLLSQQQSTTVPLLSEYFEDEEGVEEREKPDNFTRFCFAGLAMVTLVTALVLVVGGVF